MSEEIIGKKRGGNHNSPTVGNNALQVEKGDLATFIQSMTKLRKLPKCETDAEIEVRIDLYFQWCIDNDMKPGVEGLSLAMGISRKTLWDWEQNRSWSYGRRAELIKQAKQVISCSIEQLMLQNKVNVIGGIFMMKNHFNYVDRTELDVLPGNPLGDRMSTEDIMRNIPHDIPIDADYSDNDYSHEEIAMRMPHDTE